MIIVLYAKKALIKFTSNNKLTMYIEPRINTKEKINQIYTNRLIYKFDNKCYKLEKNAIKCEKNRNTINVF